MTLLLALVGLLAAAGSAQADTLTSQNWSGYAAHRSGVHFRRISAAWRQPAGSCSGGQSSYSAFWVGLGGFSLSSSGLEQIGSELDCTAAGAISMSAWYELVPAPSHTIRMTILPGDLIAASVSVSGARVTLSLTDRTRHVRFTRTLADSAIDNTSAEWIAEAPSECSSSGSCNTLPLADFGSVRFAGAAVQTIAGRTGGITSSRWGTTKLVLAPEAGGPRFAAYTTAAGASPGSLENAGSAFSVIYSAQSSAGAGSGAYGPPGGSGGAFGARRR